MKRIAIYTVVSMMIMLVIILAISGNFVAALLAIAISVAYMYFFTTTERGRKWWRTWYRVGLEFDRFLEGRVNSK